MRRAVRAFRGGGKPTPGLGVDALVCLTVSAGAAPVDCEHKIASAARGGCVEAEGLSKSGLSIKRHGWISDSAVFRTKVGGSQNSIRCRRCPTVGPGKITTGQSWICVVG